MTRYQLDKARKIERCLRQSFSGRRGGPRLAKLLARADENQWRSLSFAAGVPVADKDCMAAVVALLGGKTISETRAAAAKRS